MGYESRFYIVEKHGNNLGKEMTGGRTMYYGEKIAMFNMCKVYHIVDRIKSFPNTETYIYSDDGDTMILEDMYGEALTEIPLDKMANIVREVMENNEYGYRRYKPFLAMLEAFELSGWNNLVVLHYGY